MGPSGFSAGASREVSGCFVLFEFVPGVLEGCGYFYGSCYVSEAEAPNSKIQTNDCSPISTLDRAVILSSDLFEPVSSMGNVMLRDCLSHLVMLSMEFCSPCPGLHRPIVRATVLHSLIDP